MRAHVSVPICTSVRVFNISVVDLSNGDSVCLDVLGNSPWVPTQVSVCVLENGVICKAVSMPWPPSGMAAFSYGAVFSQDVPVAVGGVCPRGSVIVGDVCACVHPCPCR